jgi:hypothetical protein
MQTLRVNCDFVANYDDDDSYGDNADDDCDDNNNCRQAVFSSQPLSDPIQPLTEWTPEGLPVT